MSTIFFFGHHKCASTWVHKVLERLSALYGFHYAYFYTPGCFEEDLERYCRQHSIQICTYANADYQFIQKLNNFRAFHLVRDPRDILVSAYFSHLKTHRTEGWPELSSHRKKLEQLNKREGLLEDIRFTTQLPTDGYKLNPFRNMEDWNYKNPDILELTYEELTKDPQTLFPDIFRFLGILQGRRPGKLRRRLSKILQNDRPLAIDYQDLSRTLEELSFERLSKGRSAGTEDRASHYRKGVPGDWENHFEEVHRDFVKQHFQSLLLKLGYVKDEAW